MITFDRDCFFAEGRILSDKMWLLLLPQLLAFMFVRRFLKLFCSVWVCGNRCFFYSDDYYIGNKV